MREIKFRSWYLETRMVYSDDMVAENKLGSFFERYVDSDAVMQYTGLKDKNGKEIYEGDIVDLQPDQDNKNNQQLYEIPLIPVFYRAIHTSANHPLHFHKFAPDRKWVVIGNIYENPELI